MRGEWKLESDHKKKKKEKRELKRVRVKVKIMSMMVNNTIRPVPFPVSKPREYTSLYYKIKEKKRGETTRKTSTYYKNSDQRKKDRITKQEGMRFGRGWGKGRKNEPKK